VLSGPTAETIFAEALAALAELLPEAGEGKTETCELELGAADLPALLARWLEELVYLSETSGLVPERVERLQFDDTRLKATVSGRLTAPQTLIKAVTYHRLELAQLADGSWSARVILDV
jgi:SHS2 domain-containing protein